MLQKKKGKKSKESITPEMWSKMSSQERFDYCIRRYMRTKKAAVVREVRNSEVLDQQVSGVESEDNTLCVVDETKSASYPVGTFIVSQNGHLLPCDENNDVAFPKPV